jgi:arginyl-tRNA--protein-N-Asp/Glu arginylyltransferase
MSIYYIVNRGGGSRFKVQGSGFRVLGSGSGFRGSGFMVQRRRRPEKITRLRRAASQIEKESLKKRILQRRINIEYRTRNSEYRSKEFCLFKKD